MKHITNKIPKENLIKGHLYRLHSRNLMSGVFDGERGFVGIREKFGDPYLFTEYYTDGEVFATATPVEDLGPIPDGIEVLEYVEGTFDQHTDRLVCFDEPIADGGRGWYYVDTNEPSQAIRPCVKMYKPLFDYLIEKEKSIV